MTTKLRNIKIHEISLVDKPANQSAKVVLAKRGDDETQDDLSLIDETQKREFSADERRRDAKSGAAMSDGSFPIENKSDLHNAMRAVGRAKDPGKAKAHIRARAKALGLTGELSDAFKSVSFTNSQGHKITISDDGFDLEFGKTAPAGDAGNAESTEVKMLDAMIKALGLSAEATEEDVMKAIADRDAKIAEKEAAIAKKEEEAAVGKEEIEKAVSSMKDELAKSAKRIADLEEKETITKFERMAFDLAIDGVNGDMVRKAYEGDGKMVAKLFEMLASAHAAVEEAGTFREIGTAKGATSNNAMDELNALANEMQKSNPGLTFAAAFSKVYEDPKNGKLVAKEREQNRPQ